MKKTSYGFKITNQTKLELIDIHHPIKRGTGYGRIAFSCPTDDVKKIEKMMMENDEKIVIRQTVLGTKGKVEVTVVILGDRDGQEICFVGEENYIKLCKSEDDATQKFEKALNQSKKSPDDNKKYDTGEDEQTKFYHMKT